MSVLTLFSDVSNAAGKSLMGILADDFGDDMHPQITPPMIASLPKVRRKEIIRIRRQLAGGTYDLDERLDAVVELILMDITPSQREFP